MIRLCQGKTELSLHLLEEVPEALQYGPRIALRFAFVDPLRIRPTRQRGQTSICGNSLGKWGLQFPDNRKRWPQTR